MHPGAVSMRVSSVLRSAEAYLDARCNSGIDDYRVSSWLSHLIAPFEHRYDDYRVLTGDGVKNLIQLPELCRSSLRRGHANLLCIYILFIDGTARRRATISVRRIWTNSQVSSTEPYGPTVITIGFLKILGKMCHPPHKCIWLSGFELTWPKAVNSVEFPGGPPAQYWPGLASLSYGVRMGSGVFDAVWSTANCRYQRLSWWEG